ncbi:hypothetical protein Prudu_020206 [Prunus dulcis]|uniref:Uncharacterized protein n=1 Tax=Prunus dulcis TaxID=3755 RepID=A0A4Y1RWH5_PRUDU|nr:hypothetical protein Prudu_020206 [Prunus dulcis]
MGERGVKTATANRLRGEIKDLLKEASSLSQPSTFAQAAKLRRMAAVKEKELANCNSCCNSAHSIMFIYYSVVARFYFLSGDMVPFYGWEILTLVPDFQIKNCMARRENFHISLYLKVLFISKFSWVKPYVGEGFSHSASGLFVIAPQSVEGPVWKVGLGRQLPNFHYRSSANGEVFGTVLHKHRQIGNAVPPTLAYALGTKLKEAIDSKRLSSQERQVAQ